MMIILHINASQMKGVNLAVQPNPGQPGSYNQALSLASEKGMQSDGNMYELIQGEN